MPVSKTRKKRKKSKEQSKEQVTQVEQPRRSLGDMLLENFGSAKPRSIDLKCDMCKVKLDGFCAGKPEYTSLKILDCMRTRAYMTAPIKERLEVLN